MAMYLIRKINPWNMRDKNGDFFSIGNPVVFATDTKAVAVHEKKELELQAIMENPLPNFYEYWDVDASDELIQLNRFLVQNHDYPILTTRDRNEGNELLISEVIPDIYFDRRFTEDDMLLVQAFTGVYYYGIQKVEVTDKYVIIADITSAGTFLLDSEFKIYDTEAEAQSVIAKYSDDTLRTQKTG